MRRVQVIRDFATAKKRSYLMRGLVRNISIKNVVRMVYWRFRERVSEELKKRRIFWSFYRMQRRFKTIIKKKYNGETVGERDVHRACQTMTFGSLLLIKNKEYFATHRPLYFFIRDIQWRMQLKALTVNFGN